jgi:CBS domain containing-hemolysin-like protein
VHETVTADRVLRELRERRSHQSRVVDEAGGTSGLLTLEDVLSELLGHVGDEFKTAHPAVESLPDGRVRMPGGMTVQDASAALATSWDTDAATVGGMVIEALGHIPVPGERISVGEYDFEIERLADRAVESVIAVKLPTPRDEDDES